MIKNNLFDINTFKNNFQREQWRERFWYNYIYKQNLEGTVARKNLFGVITSKKNQRGDSKQF